MQTANPIINGFAHQWSSVEISVNGIIYLGVSSIDFSTDTDGQDVMGTSAEAIARTAGNAKHSGSMEMYLDDAEKFLAALQAIGAGKGYMQVPFDVTVQYQEDDRIYGAKLVSCLVKQVSASHQKGSEPLTQKFELRPFRIKRGIGPGSALQGIISDIEDLFAQ